MIREYKLAKQAPKAFHLCNSLHCHPCVSRHGVRPVLKKGVFSCAGKSHAIFFNENQGRIDILRVLHEWMDLRKYLD